MKRGSRGGGGERPGGQGGSKGPKGWVHTMLQRFGDSGLRR